MSHSSPTRRASDLDRHAVRNDRHRLFEADRRRRGADPADRDRTAAQPDGAADNKAGHVRRDPLDAIRIIALDLLAGEHADRHRNRSEEHTSEFQSLMRISYYFFRWQQKIQT